MPTEPIVWNVTEMESRVVNQEWNQSTLDGMAKHRFRDVHTHTCTTFSDTLQCANAKVDLGMADCYIRFYKFIHLYCNIVYILFTLKKKV